MKTLLAYRSASIEAAAVKAKHAEQQAELQQMELDFKERELRADQLAASTVRLAAHVPKLSQYAASCQSPGSIFPMQVPPCPVQFPRYSSVEMDASALILG
jgi:hypothetical protein